MAHPVCLDGYAAFVTRYETRAGIACWLTQTSNGTCCDVHMTYRLSTKEFEAVSSLSPRERLQHFVKRVADWEEVWSLKNHEGWVLAGVPNGQEAAPFWPHPDYARACRTEQWADCEPAAIELRAFIDRWIPGLARDGRAVSVFPVANGRGVIVTADALRLALMEELQAWYESNTEPNE